MYLPTPTDDKVPNIRLMLCKLLPKLKALAVDPVDQKLLASLDACVSSFYGETDVDVLALLKSALNNMDDVDRAKVRLSLFKNLVRDNYLEVELQFMLKMFINIYNFGTVDSILTNFTGLGSVQKLKKPVIQK